MTGAPAPHNPLTAADWFAALAMNLLWGLNLVALKMSVDLVHPLTAAFVRQTIVFIVLIPMLKIIPGRMRDLLGLGVLSGFIFYCLTNLSFAASSNVPALAIAGQLGVPFALILAVLVLGERIAMVRTAGVTLAFAGVAAIVFDPDVFDQKLGMALSVLASMVWAICSLIQRRLAGVPVLTIYSWVGLLGAVLLLPLVLVYEPNGLAALPHLPLTTLGWVAFSALGSTIGGQGAMSWLLQRHPMTVVVPLTLLNPVISVIVSSWWFHTPLTTVMMTGGSMVMIGIAIVSIRTAKAHEGQLDQAGQ